MNAGARASHGDALVFVHADTLVPTTFARDIAAALSDPAVVGGRFDVRLDESGLPYRIIGAMISLRSRISRTGTGDQAIFVRRDVFDSLGGFPELELCEDLEFSRRLKRAGRVACLRTRVTTSARRWSRDGVARTVVKMWMIRAMYLMGVPPARLKRHVLRYPLAIGRSTLDRLSRADNNGSSEVRRGQSRNLHHHLLPLLHAGQEPAQEQEYCVR